MMDTKLNEFRGKEMWPEHEVRHSKVIWNEGNSARHSSPSLLVCEK